jgi:hypothetical protein
VRLFLLCLIALTVAGCASAKPAAPRNTPTTSSATTRPSTPGSMPPGTAPIRLFANPVALSFSAEPGVVLHGRAEVTRFVHWLRTRPRPADADAPVADALVRGVSQAPTLVAIAQNYGCASMTSVSLGSRGTNLVLVPSGLKNHPECFRANLVVAVFALPAPLPFAVTLTGQQPNTAWR